MVEAELDLASTSFLSEVATRMYVQNAITIKLEAKLVRLRNSVANFVGISYSVHI